MSKDEIELNAPREPMKVNVSHLSPDDLMRMNGYLAGCVSILIQACKLTADGRKAISAWDKYRQGDEES